MAILEIVKYPDPVLMKPTRELTPVEIQTGFADGLDLKGFAQNMLETMYAAPGIGLAAPQVGKLLRLHVMDITAEHNQPQILLNPRIVKKKGRIQGEEGCLSFPGIFGMVRRFESVEVEFSDFDGATHRIVAEGLKSRCLQHEIDHLDGILYIDKMSVTGKFSIRKELDELRRNYLAKK